MLRRPFLNRVITSPFVHDVVNWGITHYLPGFPTLPATTPNTADTTIYVDGSVKRSNEASAKYLGEAKTIMDQLMAKEQAVKGSPVATHPGAMRYFKEAGLQ